LISFAKLFLLKYQFFLCDARAHITGIGPANGQSDKASLDSYRVAAKGQATKDHSRSTWEFHMSCYSQTEMGATFAARRTFSLRTVFNRVVDRVRVARNHRRQRQELIEYLASDHRAANDLGITRVADTSAREPNPR
jgi:hypothetical protein